MSDSTVTETRGSVFGFFTKILPTRNLKQKLTIYSPFSVQFFLRPLVSIVGGIFLPLILLLVLGILWIPLSFLAGSFLEPLLDLIEAIIDTVWTLEIFILLMVASTIFIATGDQDPRVTVPIRHVGVVTFFGKRLRVVVDEGNYNWIGSRIGLGISHGVPLKDPTTDGERQGFVYVGERYLVIWESSTEKDIIDITTVAKAGSTLVLKAAIMLQTVDPVIWGEIDFPIKKIADTARSGFRHAINFFLDRDAIAVKSAVRDIMAGSTILTAFTRDRVDMFLKGSMVRDRGGMPMFKTIDAVENERGVYVPRDQIDEGIEEFRSMVSRDGDPEFVSQLQRNEGVIHITDLSIEDKLIPIIMQSGAVYLGTIVSDMEFSDEVRTASNQAASEGAQLAAQTASARTQREVRRILAEALDAPNEQLAAVLAAAQDKVPGINIVMVPGGNPLTNGLIAAGSVLNPNQ